MTATTYVDAKAAVRDWTNANTNLVGAGKPFPLGAHLTRLRSPASGCYILLILLASTADWGVENPDQRARISAHIYGPTQEAADVAGAAFGNEIIALNGRPAATTGAVIRCVDNISGPFEVPNIGEYLVVVDADYYLTPA